MFGCNILPQPVQPIHLRIYKSIRSVRTFKDLHKYVFSCVFWDNFFKFHLYHRVLHLLFFTLAPFLVFCLMIKPRRIFWRCHCCIGALFKMPAISLGRMRGGNPAYPRWCDIQLTATQKLNMCRIFRVTGNRTHLVQQNQTKPKHLNLHITSILIKLSKW